MSYIGLGQTNNQTPAPAPTPQWAEGITAIVDPLATATGQIYASHARNEIDKARLQAGLPPLPLPGQLPPPPPKKGFGVTGLLLGLVLVGGVLYIVTHKKDAS